MSRDGRQRAAVSWKTGLVDTTFLWRTGHGFIFGPSVEMVNGDTYPSEGPVEEVRSAILEQLFLLWDSYCCFSLDLFQWKGGVYAEVGR